jgi:plasmid stabilization system protein ParE
MGFKVIFAPEAIESLATIVRHIARDKPTAAERCGMRLIDRAEMLAEFPELGSPYPKRVGVRRLWCKPYFIYYRIKQRERVVEVMNYWHPARLEPELRGEMD